jgi:DNA-binding NtrC family response regulator
MEARGPGDVDRPFHVVLLDADEARRERLANALRANGAECVGYGVVAVAAASAAAGADALVASTSVGPEALVAAVGALGGGEAGVAPYVLVFGPLDVRAAFMLARAGASAYLEEEPDAATVLAHLWAERPAPPLAPVVRRLMPHLGLVELRHAFRAAMLRQALALSGGSLSGAARLLRISRQAVQQLIDEAR